MPPTCLNWIVQLSHKNDAEVKSWTDNEGTGDWETWNPHEVGIRGIRTGNASVRRGLNPQNDAPKRPHLCQNSPSLIPNQKRDHAFSFYFCLLTLVCFPALGLLSTIEFSQAKSLQVRIDRWLEISQINGRVTYFQGKTAKSAQVGTRLQAVGDAIQTGEGSSAVLSVDTNVGFVNVSENTILRVQELRVSSDGGRVTRLHIDSGQARLQVRPFTTPGSQLEIQTPAGVSAVRGTEFGVTVHPDGSTGIATSEGSVVAKAQGQEITVNAGFEVLLIPGEVPSSPVPLTALTRESGLKLQVLTAANGQMARIVGQVNPVNLVIVANRPLVTDRNGQFDVTVPLPPNRRIVAVVRTPLGKNQVYELAVP